jgi:hypothetical protein
MYGIHVNKALLREMYGEFNLLQNNPSEGKFKRIGKDTVKRYIS